MHALISAKSKQTEKTEMENVLRCNMTFDINLYSFVEFLCLYMIGQEVEV